jgi:hypothetical protein
MRAAKESKQKKVAIVLGVLLLAVVGFQAPRIMKMFKGDEVAAPPPPATTTTAPAAPTGPVSLQPPTLAGGGGAPTGGGTTEPGGLTGSEPAPLASAGQLVSFSRFESKDPFAPQLEDAAAPADAAGAGSGKPDGGKSGNGGKTQPPATVVRAAVISVNGAEETVSPGGGFPAANPLFRLVSLSKTSVAIAIAGGSYADGARTVQLRRGEPLTLMNTADGVRYELRLVSLIQGSAPQS